jgi:hypothetical protein
MRRIILKAIFSAFTVITCFAQSDNSQVIISGTIQKFDKNELKIDFISENNSGEDVFIATNPRQINGEFGFYLSLDESDNSLLKISSRIYPAPLYYAPYSNGTTVELAELRTGEKLKKTIQIKLPTKETMPPYDGDSYKKKTINAKKIKRIELSIGYFFEDEGMLDFLKTKRFGWFINGNESFFSGVNKGTTFLQIQKLATVTIDKQSKNKG